MHHTNVVTIASYILEEGTPLCPEMHRLSIFWATLQVQSQDHKTNIVDKITDSLLWLVW